MNALTALWQFAIVCVLAFALLVTCYLAWHYFLICVTRLRSAFALFQAQICFYIANHYKVKNTDSADVKALKYLDRGRRYCKHAVQVWDDLETNHPVI